MNKDESSNEKERLRANWGSGKDSDKRSEELA